MLNKISRLSELRGAIIYGLEGATGQVMIRRDQKGAGKGQIVARGCTIGSRRGHIIGAGRDQKGAGAR